MFTGLLPRALCALLLASLASARTVHAHDATDYQQWLVLNIEGSLDPVLRDLRVALNAESRLQNTPRAEARVDAGGNAVAEEQNPSTLLLLRPHVGYQVAPWLVAWAGYGWTPIFYRNELREDVSEHRAFWQITGSGTLGPLQLGYRTRFENRYRASGDSATRRQGEGEWAHRARQLVRAAFTLVPGQPWQAIIYDELLVHLNRTHYITEPGLDQNRLFAGIGYQATHEFRVEFGYLNQAVHRFTDRDQLNHVLWASLNLKIGAASAPANSAAPPAPRTAPAVTPAR